jgi:2-isopropylmalate synthase
MDRVIVYDTTLRDGEQAPGFSMTPEEKLRMARQLARLGVDVLEVGFPSSSPDEVRATELIAEALRDGPVISVLARAHRDDIETAARALRASERPRIHTFVAVSDIHLAEKHGITREEAIERGRAGVRWARDLCDDVQFGFEDASRSDPDFLCRIVEQMIAAGARTVDIGDTVGYVVPEEFAERIVTLMHRVPNIDKAVISVHCHNDLGLAVANSLAALRVGARQVDCTINGIGERAGNASLEEIVMALKIRPGYYGLHTEVRTAELYPTSKLLEEVTGISVQPNKAIVGANAFSHEAGIHQHAVLKNPLTYEIMTPSSVGRDGNRIVLGKHSGRHALRQLLQDRGLGEPAPDDIDAIFAEFKRRADAHKTVSVAEIVEIARRQLEAAPSASPITRADPALYGDVEPYWRDEEVDEALVHLRAGELVLLKGDIGYGFFGMGEAALRSMYELKGRPHTNPCIFIANADIMDDIAEYPHPEIREWILETMQWTTLAVVLPARSQSRLVETLPPWVRQQSVTNGTLALFLRTGPYLDVILRRAHAEGRVFVGTSANLSFQGNVFEYGDLPIKFVRGVGYSLDHGRSLHANDQRRATTIVNFTNWTIKRRGVNVERIEPGFLALAERVKGS